MNKYIGIDLGTSALKGILADAAGNILASSSRSYPVDCPHDGWSEQSPEDWLEAALSVIDELAAGDGDVRGISFGGQMHGLVALDENDRVIRPCILWNDGRTEKQTKYLNSEIGRERLSSLTGNIAFAGFTAPKLLWLRENEPESFSRIRRIMLPKDYLTYMLTGSFATDFSDAGGTLLLDVKNKCWSREMCGLCGVKDEWLPRLCESYEAVGTLKPEYAKKLMPAQTVTVTAGAGDNAASAVGTGTLSDGSCNISLGTSGTIFIACDKYCADDRNALHSFVHASGGYHLLGCILSAASCRRWWLEDIIGSADYDLDEKGIAACSTGELIFLPYLAGERSPHNDATARGAFIGLSSGTTRAQMSRAVMEGVAFALRDCLEAARSGGAAPAVATLCGGGARSAAWRQIVADVLDIPVRLPETEQGAAYGAALLAMTGCGEYESVAAAAEHCVRFGQTIMPDKKKTMEYAAKYELFRQLYPALKEAARKSNI